MLYKNGHYEIMRHSLFMLKKAKIRPKVDLKHGLLVKSGRNLRLCVKYTIRPDFLRDSNLIDIKIFGLFQLDGRATVSYLSPSDKHAYPEI